LIHFQLDAFMRPSGAQNIPLVSSGGLKQAESEASLSAFRSGIGLSGK
jgi:hypothetical protein